METQPSRRKRYHVRLCGGIKDIPVEQNASRTGFWAAYNCGYQAYRERKILADNPYKNDELKESWSVGWKDAREFCTTGRRPPLMFRR